MEQKITKKTPTQSNGMGFCKNKVFPLNCEMECLSCESFVPFPNEDEGQREQK
jgi:hypothetical protein